MNKKYMYSFVALFAMVFVSAGLITYFGQVVVDVGVTQPITINGQDAEYIIPAYTIPNNMAGAEPFLGNAIMIENSANFPLTVQVVDTSSDSVNDGIEVNYVGKMTFAEKNLVPGEILSVSEEVIYSITGDTFVATGIPNGYELIYYPDMDGGFAENVQNILVYGEDTFTSLPVLEDTGDDYCNILTGDSSELANPNALVCDGAKLWLVEDTYIDALKLGTWTLSKIMFETDLITYTVSTTGEVLVPALSTITVYPQYTLDSGLTTDTYTITTKVVPAIA